MSDDELGGELDRVLRTALTAAGQLAERAARARADAERSRHAATLAARQDAERNLARQVEAGRAVYGPVRDAAVWERPNAQRHLGEALVAAQALQEVDPLAVPAAQYIRGEARRRHGVDADAWLATAVQMYLEETRESGDRRSALDETENAADTHDPDHAVAANQRTEEALEPSAEAGAQAVSLAGERAERGSRGSDQETAAQGFPHTAAEDHNRSSTQRRRAPRPARRPGRVPTRDRGR